MNAKNIISIMQYLKDMEASVSISDIGSAILAYHLSEEEYAAERGLSDEAVADLANLLWQISTSEFDDARFSGHDYVDALVHTAYDVDPQKMIELGKKDFSMFADLMAELAAQKRAVYEEWEYDDERLTSLLKDTKVGSITV